LVDSAGGGCLSRSWDIFWCLPSSKAANLDPFAFQIEGGNHALVRACADSSAGALGESATLYVMLGLIIGVSATILVLALGLALRNFS